MIKLIIKIMRIKNIIKKLKKVSICSYDEIYYLVQNT